MCVVVLGCCLRTRAHRGEGGGWLELAHHRGWAGKAPGGVRVEATGVIRLLGASQEAADPSRRSAQLSQSAPLLPKAAAHS